jgi:hypothetical protein
MTCEHVLDVIDAAPFVDVAPATLEAALAHARTCVTCGPALERAEALTVDLGALAHPAPPVEFANIVLARIAQIDARAEDAAIDKVPSSPAASRLPVWSAAAIAFAASVAMALLTIVRSLTTAPATPPGSGFLSMTAMLATTRDLLPLAAVLLVFVAGLFATVTGRTSFTNS